MGNTSSVIDFDDAARLYTRLMHLYFVYGSYKINLQSVYSLLIIVSVALEVAVRAGVGLSEPDPDRARTVLRM
jgi:hypothetical protein